jgi:hypothetical protein
MRKCEIASVFKEISNLMRIFQDHSKWASKAASKPALYGHSVTE